MSPNWPHTNFSLATASPVLPVSQLQRVLIGGNITSNQSNWTCFSKLQNFYECDVRNFHTMIFSSSPDKTEPVHLTSPQTSQTCQMFWQEI